MRFNLFALASMMAILVGCEDFYGEKPVPLQPIDLEQGSQSTCTIPIDKLSDDFLNATLGASQVEQALTCAEQIIREVEKHLETKTAGTITRREIETILNT